MAEMPPTDEGQRRANDVFAPRSTDDSAPMPNHHTDRFMNGHDPEVEEPPYHHHEVSEPKGDETKGVKEWLGSNIFAIIGLLAAFGLITVPASRWQHDALATKVEGLAQNSKDDFKEQTKRIKALEDAQIQTVLWQNKSDAKQDRIESKLDFLISQPTPAVATPAVPPPPAIQVEQPKANHRAAVKRPAQKPPVQAPSGFSLFR